MLGGTYLIHNFLILHMVETGSIQLANRHLTNTSFEHAVRLTRTPTGWDRRPRGTLGSCAWVNCDDAVLFCESNDETRVKAKTRFTTGNS